jgi:hypothetical protein
LNKDKIKNRKFKNMKRRLEKNTTNIITFNIKLNYLDYINEINKRLYKKMLNRKKIKLMKKKVNEFQDGSKRVGKRNNKISLKLSKIKKYININETYTKIKFKQDYFSIGDNLMVRDFNENFLVAKLSKIIPVNGNKKYPYWPTIEVEW